MIPILSVLLVGCMTFDGMIHGGDRKDAYDFSASRVPPELIEVVSYESADGTLLSGVWTHQAEPKPPLIFFHGNGGAVDTYPTRLDTYWSWGEWDVFHADYRGYGLSEGAAGPEILELDGIAAVRHVAESTGVEPENIPWIALSLGAAVAAHTNRSVANAGMVLENMFPNTSILMEDGSGVSMPDGWFFEHTWDNLAALDQGSSPTFVIHGLADDYISPDYGPVVYEHAPEPRWLWQPEGVNHSDIEQVIPEEYQARVARFLADPARDPSTP
jgi:pimeloyl-ACP methyl ester carboxylesterase